tara:strand:- start:188447 stop:188701 length:255 start_codon:yes stop_codon:yes gene_type:complete
MNLVFAGNAWKDYLYWQRADAAMFERINLLIRDSLKEPFEGLGKPAPLQHALAGYWSRRINHEHRFVYRVEEEALLVVQLRFRA